MADSKEQMVPMTEVLKMMQQMQEDNIKANREFARTLGQELTHPQPTEAEARRRAENREADREIIAIKEAGKKRRRLQCAHRRMGHQWGMFNNTSVIAWHYTNFSYFGEDKQHKEGPTVAIGVCQWCQSEFRPGDPDYAEKLSWGVSPVESHQMHVVTGNWMNG